MLHILRLHVGQDKLRHPLPDDRRQLKAMAAETCRAVQAIIPWQFVENWMKVGCIVIYTRPSSARYGSSQPGNATSSHCSEVRDLLLSQTLCIIIRIAWSKDIL